MSLSRSGRVLVFANEVPFETDVLYTNLYKMVDVSNLAQAVLGGPGTSNATLASGLPATPTSPATLTINIGSGVIYVYTALDSTDYSTIPADTVDFLYKPFTQVSSVVNVAGFTPPGSGTLNYLVQAAWSTTDTDSASRPFFNPSDPENPIFQTVNQTRLDRITYTLKSAVSPAIPTPDSGNVGLYVVSVSSGQTSIISGNISVYSGAPFITESLTQKISTATGDTRYARPVQIQNSSFVYGTTTGSANTYAISLTPSVTSLVSGLNILAKINVTNTGASTLNVNGLGAISIVNNKGNPLFNGDMITNRIAELLYDGTNFVLLNALSGSANTFIGASMYMSAQQNIPTIFPNYTVFNFDTIQNDPFGICNTGTFSMTIPINGYYEVSTVITSLNTSGVENLIDVEVQVATANRKRLSELDCGAGKSATLNGSVILLFNAGDIIRLAGSCQTNGFTCPDMASLFSLRTNFSLNYLGN